MILCTVLFFIFVGLLIVARVLRYKYQSDKYLSALFLGIGIIGIITVTFISSMLLDSIENDIDKFKFVQYKIEHYNEEVDNEYDKAEMIMEAQDMNMWLIDKHNFNNHFPALAFYKEEIDELEIINLDDLVL